ncbi:MAG: PqiC family protein [Candidatus Binatia bacterium]
MGKYRLSSFIFHLLALTALAGCPSFSPQPDRTRYFALTAQAQADGAAKNPVLGEIWLGVGPIRIPGYLDREELVVRVAQNRFDVAQNDRWIEPLEESLSRVVAQNLHALLGSERIVRYPWPNSRRITHQVEIEIFRFEPAADGEAQLSARWAINDIAGKQVLAGKTSFFKRPIKGPSREAAVDAMSELLADLSREIAEAVRTAAQQKR